MTFFEELTFRGIVKQTTDERLGKILEKESLTLYAGFDPTSDSLHVGSMFGLITLRRFQNAGHKPIFVAGGATGMIGDPSGKTQERQLLDAAALERNLAGIQKCVANFLDLSGSNKALIRNNADWFKSFSYLDFLRDVGKHFTVNHMMAKESVRARLEDREHGISYTEFSYMLLQAFDFYHLMKADGCRLQIGGSDQWGNITAGCELIRRMGSARNETYPEVFGMTHPLVMKADGTKFGKTESGTVWLDPNKTSPYHFYQFFVQTADADVMTYIKYFTFLKPSEILEIEEEFKKSPEKRKAQQTLAREVTRFVHGPEELEKAEKASQALFENDIKKLDSETLLKAFSSAPRLHKSRGQIATGIPIVDLLVETQLLSSKTAARKEIAGGGVYLNDDRISDMAFVVRTENLIAGAHLVLRKGRKNYYLVSFE